MGMDSREISPELTRAAIHLAAEVRSFERAEVTIKNVLGQEIPRSTIRRLAKQVGGELAEIEQLGSTDVHGVIALENKQGVIAPDDKHDKQEVVVPEVAVVSCDGGRMRTREPGTGRVVRPSGEKGWRETKNASLERMTLPENHSDAEDPCPRLPTSFRSVEKVADIAEKPVPNVDEPAKDTTEDTSETEPKNTSETEPKSEKERVIYEGPRRVLRTVQSSLSSSEKFGPKMQREAERRRFFESPLRAFIGDGLNWNWSVWKEHFPTFVPILDFIHVIHYIFAAAMCLGSSDTEGWTTFVKFITLCWQGQVDAVIAILIEACERRGVDFESRLDDNDPNKPLADAIRYLRNNRDRMDYPRYRKLGLPVTSSSMESLVKQISMRVKGTEMFWEDPDGAEAILHLRAAALSEDGRLDRYLSKRSGWPFVRRTTSTTAA